MAKKNNKGAAPGTNNTNKGTDNTIEVIDANKLKETVNARPSTGLDANHQVDMLMGLKAYFKDDKNAENIFGKDVTDRVNNITAIGFVSVLTNEILFGKSDFAARMNVSQRQAVIELAPLAGVSINPKLLPAPDADGTALITSNAVTISKEAEKAAKKEKKIIDSKPETDPSKITNNDQLVASLVFILSDAKTEPRPAGRMARAIEFLRSYQLICANKCTDEEKKKSLLETIKNKTTYNLLDEIRVLVGECPFTSLGLAHYIYKTVADTKNPISAYCLLRNASKNKTTGEVLSDDTLAATIKVLIKWSVDPYRKKYENGIKEAEKTFKKDKKAYDNYVEPILKNIEYCNTIENAVLNPDMDVVDTLVEKFNEKDATAKTIVKYISGTFYSIDGNTLDEREDKDELLKDIQQRAGIIVNLFRDPLSQDIRYKEANLTYSPKKEEEGEQSKN